MTTKTTARRIEALEAKTTPPGKLLVCSCATHAGRRNITEHETDCPALTAAPRDTVLTVHYVSDFPK